jgi:hypothetical protein
MTFYQSKPVTIEAFRFDGSGPNAQHICEWVKKHSNLEPIFHPAEDGHQGHGGWPAQLDIPILHVKVAAIGDYVLREIGENGHRFRVLTEAEFKAMYDHICLTCSGQVRETTNLVCQTCGHDYSKGE